MGIPPSDIAVIRLNFLVSHVNKSDTTGVVNEIWKRVVAHKNILIIIV